MQEEKKLDERLSKLHATGEYIFVIEDQKPQQMRGLILPASATSFKPNTGLIISVGAKINDKNVKKDRMAVFNPQAGQVIHIFNTDVKVLNYAQLLGVTT